MEQKTFLAALTTALLLMAAALSAQNDDRRTYQPSAGYGRSAPANDQAVPSQDLDHHRKAAKTESQRRAREKAREREQQNDLPNRMEPSRTFPGDLPEKTTTPGSVDREGRVLQDNRSTPAPPSPSQGQPREDHGEYK